MRRKFLFLLPMGSLMLSGCLAKTALDIATLPVRAAGKGIDLVTTSQSESDEKRGRALRERQERLGKLERTYARQLDECEEGSRRACDDARQTYAEMQQLIPTLPREPAPD